jgi:hypothetical protein
MRYGTKSFLNSFSSLAPNIPYIKVVDDMVQCEDSLPDYVAPRRAYEATYNRTCRNSVFGSAVSPVLSHNR